MLPSASTLTTRPEFTSDIDVRRARNPSATTSVPSSNHILRNTIQHSSSSSALRTLESHYQTSYAPQASMPITIPRSQSSHPFQESCSLSARSVSVSSTPTAASNAVPLTRKSITEYSNRTFRVVFSDDSEMIIRADSHDRQIFVDAQGKRYSFDRRQPHQSEAIQERLALFYHDEQDLADHNPSQ